MSDFHPEQAMDETEAPRIAMLVDEETLDSMASLNKALQSWTERLKSQGIETPIDATSYLCAEMVHQSSRARELILRQPPKQLLGYLWSRSLFSLNRKVREPRDSCRLDKNLANELQFVLEFVHATWSCSMRVTEDNVRLNEADMSEVFATLAELRNITMLYCMAKSRDMTAKFGDQRQGELGFRAMVAWVNLRGRRYQVLEEEFLAFLLGPHDGALRNNYGMGATDIAAGIQAIADSTRTGLSDAFDRIESGMRATHADDEAEEISCEIRTEVGRAVDDLLNGGICNLSRHANLTQPLLKDLSYSPGENTEFLADGELCGTPLRTLPCLVKPGIRLGDEYYITDGQFVRDVAYRCIQRGLCARDPSYREEWNRRQKHTVEGAFTKVFGPQLKGATIYSSVYYRDPRTDNWNETDLVVAIDDVLVVVEAKAGVMAMTSPAEDFDRHMASVERLIVNACRQCGRLLEYMASTETVSFYALRDGKYVKVADLCLGDFRTVLPIGLTMEALTPFSTCLNNLTTITPLLGKHAFMSISVDDLLMLRRFLPSTGELFHYLEIRQRAGNIPDTTLINETEYLGAYISRNRFDTSLLEQRENASLVVWNYFADAIDEYFEGENAGRGTVPRQSYPKELKTVLKVLDRKRPKGWLEMDAAIRNLGSEGRYSLSKSLSSLKVTLGRHRYRRILFCNGTPFQIWLCTSGRRPPEREVRRQAEVACLLAKAKTTRVLRLAYNRRGKLTDAACMSYPAPCKSRSDYAELEEEAVAQRARAVSSEGLDGVHWG